jgi:hypothetical protein
MGWVYMKHTYVVRYGLMGQISKYASYAGGYERGQIVVIRSRRGVELGEVLLEVEPGPDEATTGPPEETQILRAAGSHDLERAREAELQRPSRYDLCRRVVQEGDWPFELVDVEALLDSRQTVLHYLGPHELSIGALLAIFHSNYDLDVVMEPVGSDLPREAAVVADDGHTCGNCSNQGGCGVGSEGHGGCSDCGIKKLLSDQRRPLAG